MNKLLGILISLRAAKSDGQGRSRGQLVNAADHTKNKQQALNANEEEALRISSIEFVRTLLNSIERCVSLSD